MPALASFLGLVYGDAAPLSGIPRGMSRNGRRAALADLVNHLKTQGAGLPWPEFLDGHRGRDFRRRGNDPKRNSQDSLEELLCHIGLLDLGDPRLLGYVLAQHRAPGSPAANGSGTGAARAGALFRTVPPGGRDPAEQPGAPLSPTSDMHAPQS